MIISRRQFLQYCGLAAAELGLAASHLRELEAALSGPAAPAVIWLHGSGCQGDSISMLNRIRPEEPPAAIDDFLIQSINLEFHSVLSSAAGSTSVENAYRVLENQPFFLVVEGGIPLAFDGEACTVWSHAGQEITFADAVETFAKKARGVVAIGTCAAFGGISAAPPNPTTVAGLRTFLEKRGIRRHRVVNISGCPAHPDWIIGTLCRLVIGEEIELDDDGRPYDIFRYNIHRECPRKRGKQTFEGFADTFGQDRFCLEQLGCRGPKTRGDCPDRLWNDGSSWCVDSNGMCFGCTEPDFPGADFYPQDEQ
jgi:hydrogenase small subunit